MPKHLSPHDRTIRTIMAKPKVAKDFFAHYLPAHIKAKVNLDAIQLQKESFIDDELRMQITDLLYTTQIAGSQGYLYLLVEHQSTPDKFMAFRVLKYMVAIMEQHLQKTKSEQLPVIYPIILHSGKQSYKHSTDLLDLFGDDKQLAVEMLFNPYQLDI